jgi:hypothetical protein
VDASNPSSTKSRRSSMSPFRFPLRITPSAAPQGLIDNTARHRCRAPGHPLTGPDGGHRRPTGCSRSPPLPRPGKPGPSRYMHKHLAEPYVVDHVFAPFDWRLLACEVGRHVDWASLSADSSERSAVVSLQLGFSPVCRRAAGDAVRPARTADDDRRRAQITVVPPSTTSRRHPRRDLRRGSSVVAGRCKT